MSDHWTEADEPYDAWLGDTTPDEHRQQLADAYGMPREAAEKMRRAIAREKLWRATVIKKNQRLTELQDRVDALESRAVEAVVALGRWLP